MGEFETLPEILNRWDMFNEDMSGIEARDEKPAAQKDIDRAVEEALDLDFASFEEVKQVFRK